MGDAALREVATAALDAAGLSGVRDVEPSPGPVPHAAAPAGGGRVMRQPTNILTLLVAVALGGTASTGAASLLGPSSDAIAQMKRDIAANSDEIEGVDKAVERELAGQNAWVMDHMIDMHDSLNSINRELGLKVMDTIKPLLPGSSQ